MVQTDKKYRGDRGSNPWLCYELTRIVLVHNLYRWKFNQFLFTPVNVRSECSPPEIICNGIVLNVISWEFVILLIARVVKQSVVAVSAVITRLVFTKRIKQKGVSGAESRVLSASCDCWCKSCRQSVDYSDRVISFSSSPPPPTALQTFPIINGTCIYLMSVSSERMLSELVGQSVSASAPSLSQVRAWSSTWVFYCSQ